MKIVNCGFNYRHQIDFKIQRPDGSGDYMLLVLRSPAFFELNGKTDYTVGNCVIIYKKGTPQIYGAKDAEFVNDWIHFEADKDDLGFFADIGLEFDKITEFKSVSELSNLVKQIFFEIYSSNKNSVLSANSYFKLLLLKMSDMLEENKTGTSKLAYQLTKLKNSIYANPCADWSIDSIAKKLLISKSYLQHQYKEMFKTSIRKDVIKSRIEYSKYLLFSTGHTVRHISLLCGYENEEHFMRSFKKETGYTPNQYRKSSNLSHKNVEDSKHFSPFSL